MRTYQATFSLHTIFPERPEFVSRFSLRTAEGEQLSDQINNDIIKATEEIGMAATVLQEISKDERERAIQRSRRMAETDRISDLLTSEEIGEIREGGKWQQVVADKDAEIADKDAEIADKDAEILRLRSQLAGLQNSGDR